MTKDTQVLNANTTKFEVPSHVSEREEASEARVGTKEVSQEMILFEVGLDTTLDCIEQGVPYIVWSGL